MIANKLPQIRAPNFVALVRQRNAVHLALGCPSHIDALLVDRWRRGGVAVTRMDRILRARKFHAAKLGHHSPHQNSEA